MSWPVTIAYALLLALFFLILDPDLCVSMARRLERKLRDLEKKLQRLEEEARKRKN